MNCELCLEDDGAAPNRIGGIDMCHRCFEGGAVAAASRRGFQIDVRCRVVGRGEKTLYITEGGGTIGRPLFDVQFRRKTPGPLLWSFVRGIRVADPLFHKIGVILSSDKERAGRFIADDGAQSAVMDLLGEDVGVFVDRKGMVKVKGRRRTDPFDQTSIERELGVLLVHLARFTESGKGWN